MIPTIRNALKMANSELNIVTNNIANAGSTGFKRSDGNFLHSYAEDIPIPGLNVGFGVVHEMPRRSDNKQGALKVTNNSLDLAVSGVGMFITASPDDGSIRDSLSQRASCVPNMSGDPQRARGAVHARAHVLRGLPREADTMPTVSH